MTSASGESICVLRAQSGEGFRLGANDVLTVIDPEGGQVADLFCVAADDPTDALSSGRSIDYNDTIRFTTGHVLYSNAGRPLLEIAQDTAGVHDFLVTPCSLQMFQMVQPGLVYHPSCHENLCRSLASLGVSPHVITTTFNAFMNVPVAPDGRIRVLPPTTKPGALVRFRALRELLVGLTACSDEGSNGGTCKPIHYRIARALA